MYDSGLSGGCALRLGSYVLRAELPVRTNHYNHPYSPHSEVKTERGEGLQAARGWQLEAAVGRADSWTQKAIHCWGWGVRGGYGGKLARKLAGV